MSFGADAPYWYDVVAPEGRERRAELSSDQCVIDGEHYFVRGALEIPVIDGDESFTWGVWVSLSQKNFERMSELWEMSGRESEPPYFGWLSTALPCYPDTLNLKTHVHTRPVGERPLIELEPTEHPLAVEQRNGISMARVKEIVECVLHDSEASV
jgi:hypothetical protein